MKTQIIPLDPHDDLISIRDRMTWAKTPRILLVWPKRGRVDLRPLDLTILRRHARALGAELGLVTRQGELRAAARELGLPLFSSAAKAQKEAWLSHEPAPLQRSSAQRPDLRALRESLPGAELFPWRRRPLFRILTFALGVLAVLAVMLVFIPSAEIRLQIPDERQSLEIAVSADPGLEMVQLSGLIPARSLKLTVNGSGSALATGKIPAPDQAATGEVLLTNLTSQAVSLPAGTRLSTSAAPAVSFETTAAVEIPAKKGKSASVPVRAVLGGSAGNLPAGALNRLENASGLALTVTNPAPTRGGTDLQLDLPTDQDRESLRKRLLADLERQVRAQFATQLAPGDLLFPASLVQLQTVEEVFAPPPGQAGSKLTLSLKVEFGMSYAAAADLQALAGRVLEASLPAGFSAIPGPLEIQPVSELIQSQGRVHWRMRATRTVRAAVDPGAVIALVTGKTARRAAAELVTTFQLTRPPEIQIRPWGWPWLPFLPLRITVSG
jgi:hypothetical protein